MGSQVSYHCNHGYHFDPDVPMTAICLEDGSWSNTAAPPRCLREYFLKAQNLLLPFLFVHMVAHMNNFSFIDIYYGLAGV